MAATDTALQETGVNKLSRSDLYTLEAYSEERPAFRAKVIAHKKDRQVALGPNATLYFEDRLTIQYQIQEMLRIEKIFEAHGIEEELEAYNPLLPDGRNWKATFMIEYADANERRDALARMVGIEDRIWVQVGDCERVFGIADEDLDRRTEDKTSAVHFMRFELSDEMAAKLRDGATLAMGIDLAAYQQTVHAVPEPTRRSLLADLT